MMGRKNGQGGDLRGLGIVGGAGITLLLLLTLL